MSWWDFCDLGLRPCLRHSQIFGRDLYVEYLCSSIASHSTHAVATSVGGRIATGIRTWVRSMLRIRWQLTVLGLRVVRKQLLKDTRIGFDT